MIRGGKGHRLAVANELGNRTQGLQPETDLKNGRNRSVAIWHGVMWGSRNGILKENPEETLGENGKPF